MTDILDELDVSDEDLQLETLDLKVIEDKIPSFNSEKLCEMIVCDRYFGCYKEIAVLCMEELAKRRISGNIFPFENYIENAYKELPQLNFTTPDLTDVLRQAIGKKVNR